MEMKTLKRVIKSETDNNFEDTSPPKKKFKTEPKLKHETATIKEEPESPKKKTNTIKAEPKPRSSASIKTETKPRSSASVKTEPKPRSRASVKAESKPRSRGSVKAQPKPQSSANSQAELQSLSSANAPADPKPTSSVSGMSWEVHYVISFNLDITDRVSKNVVKLLDEGCTIPFIARYRKEQTDGMEVHKIRDACTLLQELRAVENKVASVKATIEQQGKMTRALNNALGNAQTMTEVECLFAPFKPGHKGSLAERAKALGLEPFAMKFLDGHGSLAEAPSYINKDEEGLSSVEKIMEGVKHIIADIVHKDTKVMEKVRALSKCPRIYLHSTQSKAKVDPKPGVKAEPAHKYQNYFDNQFSLNRIQPHQVLALNRGENNKILNIKIVLPDFVRSQMLACCEQQMMHRNMMSQCRQVVEESIEDAYSRLIQPQICRLVRSNLTKSAEKESILVFSSNLKNLLLTAPLKGSTILAIDPGFTKGCKVAVISKTGHVLDTDVIYMHANFSNKAATRNQLQDLIIKHRAGVIVIGNGVACRETETVVSDLIQKSFPKLKYCIISENGASIYSVSDVAQKELPDMDVSLRGAVSIGRRLLDPLAEFVKLDPKHLGVGQYQHDMPQNQLKASLDSTIEECVSFVGVDINTCSECLLSHVSGLSAAKAKKVLEFRNTLGPFICREQLMSVKGLGEKTYEQAAGFIRVHNLDGATSPLNEEKVTVPDVSKLASEKGKKTGVKKATTRKKKSLDLTPNPLDMTWIHPESYSTTHRLLDLIQVKVSDIGQPLFLHKVQDYLNHHSIKRISELLDCGEPTVKLITEALVRPLAYDFRDEFEKPLFRSVVKSINDLKAGDTVTGKVSNVTNFGAFVDIGVECNGLIHNSKMQPQGNQGPKITLKLGDKVEAKVENIEVKRNRIGLVLVKVI